MSVQKVSVLVPPLRPVPPGAAWLAHGAAFLLGGPEFALAAARRAHAGPGRASARGRVVPSLGERLGQARAAWREQRAVRRRARQRDKLLALAGRYAATQPEFAKELFAAASNDRS